MKVAVVSKKSAYTLAEQDYSKLVIYQIILGENPTRSVEFAKKSFIYYGCWLSTTNKPTYIPRAVEVFRVGIREVGPAILGRDALQEFLRSMETSFKIEAGEIEGVGLTNGVGYEFSESGKISRVSTWELNIEFWKSLAKGLGWGVVLAVALVAGIVAGRWESLIGIGISLIQSVAGIGESATSDIISKYLITAEQAYEKFGTVDSEQAQEWVKTIMSNYTYSQYGVEIEWDYA